MFKEDEAKCASCLINGTIFSFCILQTDNITKPQDIQGLSLLPNTTVRVRKPFFA